MVVVDPRHHRHERLAHVGRRVPPAPEPYLEDGRLDAGLLERRQRHGRHHLEERGRAGLERGPDPRGVAGQDLPRDREAVDANPLRHLEQVGR